MWLICRANGRGCRATSSAIGGPLPVPVADGVRCWPRLPSLPLPTAELPPAPVFVPLPVPTTEPLLVPTAMLLPAPTAVPVPALMVVPLLMPTAVPFPAHADCRTTSGADGHAGAGPDCRHFQYQQPRCLLCRCSCHFQSHGACPDSCVTSSANSYARPRVGLFLLWRLRRSSCSGRFDGLRHVRTSQSQRPRRSCHFQCPRLSRTRRVCQRRLC